MGLMSRCSSNRNIPLLASPLSYLIMAAPRFTALARISELGRCVRQRDVNSQTIHRLPRRSLFKSPAEARFTLLATKPRSIDQMDGGTCLALKRHIGSPARLFLHSGTRKPGCCWPRFAAAGGRPDSIHPHPTRLDSPPRRFRSWRVQMHEGQRPPWRRCSASLVVSQCPNVR